MRRFYLKLITFLFLFGQCGVSFAAEISHDDGENVVKEREYNQELGLPPLNPPPDGVLTLPTFDINLGVLDSATFSWNSTMAISGDAFDGVIEPFGFFSRVDGELTVFGTAVETGPVAVSDSCDFAGCDIENVQASSSAEQLNLVGELDLSNIPGIKTDGPSTFEVELDLGFILIDEVEGIVPIGPATHFETGVFQGRWDITGFVTYDYNPVPLPGTLWLFGSGILGIASLVGRRIVRH